MANSYGEDLPEQTINSYQKFQSSISFKQNKYHVNVPFDEEIIAKVPNSYSVCKVLAKKVHVKLRKQGLDGKYFEIFEEQLNEGIIHPLPIDFNINEYKFVPHRPVIREDPLVKTTKIRAVFNCSFRNGNSPSLNDSVQFPQDLMKDLVDLFLYFRTNKYFLTADIQKAFLNVKFNRDSDANKFSFIVFHKNNFHYFKYSSAIFGFVLSPFFLQAVLRFHASLQPDLETKNYMSNHFYVDNLIVTHNSVERLKNIAFDMYDSLEDGGFHLRDWCSNVQNVTEFVDVQDSNVNSCQPFKVLGYVHNPASETFSVKNYELDVKANTRREILSGVSSIFDPCGIILPCTTLGKMIMRGITNLKLSWDEAVPKEISVLWSKFVKQVSRLEGKINIPRFTYNSQESFKLHVFADASKDLIACSVYVSQGNSSSLLFAKNKVTPMVAKTMPTLELLAFELGVKVLYKIISSEYFNKQNLTKINFYSDSQVALTWILNKFAPKRNIFACNRIKTINSILNNVSQLSLKFDIYYTNTIDNVADLITRTLTVPKMLQSMSLYHNGPDWLIKENPPVSQLHSIPTRFIKNKKLIYTVVEGEKSDSISDSIIDLTRFSSYNKLVNSLAYVFKFRDLILKRPKLAFVQYRASAIDYLIIAMQKVCFPIEEEYLIAKTITKNPPKLILQLRLYMDQEGIIRSKGRFGQSTQFSYDAVNPILISGRSPLAELLITHAHRECKHLGLNSTLYYLRNTGFWLTSARSSVMRIIGKCLTCLRYRAKTFAPPDSDDLPMARTDSLIPFSSIGIDYTGQFTLIDYSGQYIKAYILLFTCLTTRAVHLEIAPSMSVQHFINAFIRFSNRYGTPYEVYSDNAKTFLAAAKLFKSILHHDIVQDLFVSKNILFKNIPIYSPNQGGSWERMVGVTKQVLNKAYGNENFQYDYFATIISDAQKVINNRPLFYNSASQEIDVISPNMLISQRSQFPLIKFSPSNLNNVWDNSNEKNFLQKIYKTSKERGEHHNRFMTEWLKSYMLDLRAKHGLEKPLVSKNLSQWLKTGAVCLFKIPGVNNHYPLVKIVELLPSKAGYIRNVKIIRSDKTTSIISIDKLAPLEVIDGGPINNLNSNLSGDNLHNSPNNLENCCELSGDNQHSSPDNSNISDSMSSRPKRLSALNQRRFIRDLILSGDV